MASLLKTPLLARCPACGSGRLYAGLLRVAEECGDCGLSFREHEQGDGPAFFSITVLGFLVTGLATWLELSYEPPLWVHAVVWPPMILVLSIWLLRFFKALIITIQWRYLGLK